MRSGPSDDDFSEYYDEDAYVAELLADQASPFRPRPVPGPPEPLVVACSGINCCGCRWLGWGEVAG